MKKIFLFNGQGCQYFGMNKELIEKHAGFKKHLNKVKTLFMDLGAKDFLEASQGGQPNAPFDDLLLTHPAVFAFQYANTMTLLDAGIKPDLFLGYSLGEFLCFHFSGALSLEDSVRSVWSQANAVIETTPPGQMVAVLGKPQIYDDNPTVFNNISMACKNFDNHFVVSGTTDDIKSMQNSAASKKITLFPLPVNWAFHSASIDSAESSFKETSSKVTTKTVETAFVSCSQKKTINNFNADDMWTAVRKPVDFSGAIDLVESEYDNPTYIDVSPGATLATFLKYKLPASNGRRHFIDDRSGKAIENIEKLISN